VKEVPDQAADIHTAGFRAAGMTHVEQGLVLGSGHFSQVENPERTWQLITEFAANSPAPPVE
jgi:pimeloyl-ACP methyl ester carboxylesterase